MKIKFMDYIKKIPYMFHNTYGIILNYRKREKPLYKFY